MNAIRLVPVVLSCVLLAAHYLRAGSLVVVVLCLMVPVLLFVTRRWVPRVMQAVLVFSAVEWMITAYEIAGVRMAMGVPWTKAAVILGVVAAWSLGSALLFETRALRKRYRAAREDSIPGAVPKDLMAS
jgi:MFS superfamily sulfate permease-like transporter